MQQEQFSHVLRVCLGQSKYTRNIPERYHYPTIFYQTHPVMRRPLATGLNYHFIGDVGASASIGPWQQSILVAIAEHPAYIPLGATVYIMPNDNNHAQENIMVEVTLGYAAGNEPFDTYLCSGMTNYSGEGGRAWRTAQEFLGLLAGIYSGFFVVRQVLPPGSVDQVLAYIDAEVTRQADERRAAEEEGA